MLKLLRRRPVATTPPDDEAVRRLLQSPLNADGAVAQVFGSDAPTAADVHAKYLDLAAEARPRLSAFVDPAFYLQANADVAAAGMDPYLHFLSSGMVEGRDPHPLVDLAFLRGQVVAAHGRWDLDTLAAALRDGQLRPHPLFDPRWYLAQNDDVRAAGIGALEHFAASGAGEGRAPNPWFDVEWYQGHAAGVPADRYAAFVHFVRHGDAAGDSPSADFDAPAYRRAHPQLDEHGLGSLAHFLASDAAADAAVRAATATATVTAAAAADPAPAEVVVAVADDHYTGSFDAIQDGIAVGWAYDTRAPGDRVLVEIVADGQVVGRGRADGHRADLLAQGIGDGAYHFQIAIGDDVADGQAHRLHARIAGHPGAMLHGSHEFRANPRHDFVLVPVAVVAGLAGAGADGDRIVDAALTLACGAVDDAIIQLRRLANAAAEPALVALKLGDALLCAGRADEAAEAYAQASRHDATAAWAFVGLGNVRRLRGDWDGAESCYLQARALAPALAPVQARLAALRSRAARGEARRLASAGDAAAALALVVPELVADPEDPALCALANELLARAGNGAGGGGDPLLDQARRSLALLEAVMAHVETARGKA